MQISGLKMSGCYRVHLFIVFVLHCEWNFGFAGIIKNKQIEEIPLSFDIPLDVILTTSNCHSKVVVCMVNSWAYWRPEAGRYDIEDYHFDGNLCTHLVYRSILVNNETYELQYKNEELDVLKGYIGKMVNLKKSFPHLKLLLSVGGYDEGNCTFPIIAASADHTETFALSAIKLLKKYGLDGLCLDWEFPGDKTTFTTFARRLKSRFVSNNLLLMTTIPNDIYVLRLGYDVETISTIFDLILVMSFEYNGPWDKKTDHNSPLCSTDLRNILQTLLYLRTENEALLSRMVLGIPLFAHPYLLSNSSPVSNFGLHSVSNGGFQGPWSQQGDYLGYNEVCALAQGKIANLAGHWKSYWVYGAQVPMMKDDSNRWITYESPESVFEKILRTSEFGLRGVMAWTIDNDDFGGHCTSVAYPLLRTINYALHIQEMSQNFVREPKVPFCLQQSFTRLTWTNYTQATNLESKRPKITVQIANKTVGLNEMVEIECIAEGKPTPVIEWIKLETVRVITETKVKSEEIFNPKYPYEETSEDGFKYKSHACVQNPFQAKDVFRRRRFSVSDIGNYLCKASNGFGDDRMHFSLIAKGIVGARENSEDDNVTETPNTSFTDNWGWIVGGVIIVLNMTAIAVYIRKIRNRKSNGLSESEIKDFMKGRSQKRRENVYSDQEIPETIPYNHSCEIYERNYEIDKSHILGSGAFGIVYYGIVKDKPVAVKSTKVGADKQYILSLLSELKILIYLGEHRNIVNLVGASTTHLNSGVVYIFVEYCRLGNLHNHLRNSRGYLVSLITDDEFDENISIPDLADNMITTKNLVNWSHQIAKAMEYLDNKKVIHGDLAARNVLLFEKDVVKVTDFGLSRKMYDYSNYVKKNQEPLPWRWMSIESLRDLEFSSQSDMWSFGVTMWEIFSLGETPYSGISWTTDFVDRLGQNLRLHKPKYSTTSFYNIILECWRENPKDRPIAGKIQIYLSNILEEHFSKEYVQVGDINVKLEKDIKISLNPREEESTL